LYVLCARRKLEIRHPDNCIQCGACVAQCPEDALRLRYDDGRIVEAATIRRTRMNMLGRRTVAVPDPPQRQDLAGHPPRSFQEFATDFKGFFAS